MQLVNLAMLNEDYMLPCLNKKFFGIECPGCGIQRSAALLWEGDFAGAFHMYPAIYTLIALIMFVGINLFLKFKHDFKIKVSLLMINVVIIIVSYIIKMNHVIN